MRIMWRLNQFLLLVLLAGCWLIPTLSAQVSTATISGTHKESSGAMLPEIGRAHV